MGTGKDFQRGLEVTRGAEIQAWSSTVGWEPYVLRYREESTGRLHRKKSFSVGKGLLSVEK